VIAGWPVTCGGERGMSLLDQLEAAGESCTPGIRAAFLELERMLGAAQVRIAELEELLAAAQARIVELERRLGMNSKNSSLPPSRDPPGVRRPLKKKGKRRRGAQPGHAAKQRNLVAPERVDRVVDHWPEHCRGCGHVFSLAWEVGAPERRQVIELPPVRAEVTEHRLHRLVCPCCARTSKAAAPVEVPAPTTFGPRLVAFSATLTVRLRASRRNLHQALSDFLDVEPPGVGTLQHLLEEVSAATLPAYQEVRTAVRASTAVGVDETGWKKKRLRFWLWVAATPTLSFYRLSRRRSRSEREKLLGCSYAGVVTSDRAGAYRSLPVGQRQLCLAHFRRDMVAWQERGGAAGRLGTWAVSELDRVFSLWHRFKRGEITRAHLGRVLGPLQARFTRLFYQAYHGTDVKLSRMADELLGLWDALWAFSRHEGVEPTNNESERALRAAVIWRKTSFGSRSERGLRMVERLLTVAETAKKQQRGLLEFLSAAITAHRLGQVPPALLATS